MHNGVFPVPPKQIFPTQIIGIGDSYFFVREALKKAKSAQTKKAVGAAVGTGAAVVGAHVGAKRKWPKYKKFAESDIKTVDGKLKLVPKKKKDQW